MRQARFIYPLLLLLVLGLSAQALWADHAQTNGYNAGFRVGQEDARASRPADFTRSGVYRNGLEGWSAEAGNRMEYRREFRTAFRDGYRDGYRDAGGVASTAHPEAASWTTEAFTNGYREGFAHGQRDVGGVYNFSHSQTYRDATLGYESSRMAGMEAYKTHFRQGYEAGYDDGFNRRAYDARSNVPRAGMRGSQVPSSRQLPVTEEAFNNGYRAGYNQGQLDARLEYRPTSSNVYRDATQGYDSRRFASLENYKLNFRRGFETGYDDGYYGRAFEMRRDAPRGFGRRSREEARSGNLIVVPAGTVIKMRLNDSLSSRTSRQGDRFTAAVQEPVYAEGSGEIAIPTGSTVTGLVTLVERPGRIGGEAEMQLRYETITLPGGLEYSLHATTSGVDQRRTEVEQEGKVEGKSSTKRDIGTVAAGAVLGAVIGAIAGGGKGAGIGAAVGSGVGLGVILTTRGKDIDLPSGTPMEIRLQSPMELRR